MNFLIRQFFQAGQKKEDIYFHEVFFLDEKPEWDWSYVVKKAPILPKPWFELSRLCPSDRIEFIRDLWLNRLPYQPESYAGLVKFFERLDDIGIVLHRQTEEEPFCAEMVYSLRDNSSFFRGLPPCREKDLHRLETKISYGMPKDFKAFLQIHHGFGKLSELGLLQIDAIFQERQNIIDWLLQLDVSIYSGCHLIDPHTLIPFYESFGLASYQCFFADWYPGSEMGNVYLSGIDYTISDITDKKRWMEQFAFPTFLQWFVSYLEGMGVVI